jgi:hypothetical protein
MNESSGTFAVTDGIYRLVALFLLGSFAIVGLDLGRRKSATWDEGGHIAAGYSYWHYGDYRVATFNLFLAQKFLAAPVVLIGPAFPDREDASSPRDPTTLGYRLLYQSGNDHSVILRSARAMITGLGVVLGAAVLLCSARLFGRGGGLVALLTFVTCPPLMAHSALATTDIAAALLLFFATLAWWRLLHRGDAWSAVLSGAATAALVLTKYSAAAFVVIAAILTVARIACGPALPIPRTEGRAPEAGPESRIALTGRLALAAALSGFVAWLFIWAFFGFTRDPGGFTHDWSVLTPGTLSHRAFELLRDLRLFPDPFLYDLTGLRTLHAHRPGFFAGHYALDGQAWFFPAQFVLKTPVLMIAILAVAAVCLWRQRGSSAALAEKSLPGSLAYRLLPYLVLVAVYSTFAITGKVNLGIRHLLPVYPALCVLAGGAVFALAGLRRRFAGGLLAFFGLGLGFTAIQAQAHPLAWFNSFAGGTSRGYTWFLDSSTDWGEELPALTDWLANPANAALARSPVFLAYFGTALPSAYGVHATQIDSYFSESPFDLSQLAAGTYCVSPSSLQGGNSSVFGPWSRAHEENYRALLAAASTTGVASLRNYERVRLHQLFSARLCALLRQRRPDARVGHSFFVYRLSEADVERALHGPPAELIDGLPHTVPKIR